MTGRHVVSFMRKRRSQYDHGNHATLLGWNSSIGPTGIRLVLLALAGASDIIPHKAERTPGTFSVRRRNHMDGGLAGTVISCRASTSRPSVLMKGANMGGQITSSMQSFGKILKRSGIEYWDTREACPPDRQPQRQRSVGRYQKHTVTSKATSA